MTYREFYQFVEFRFRYKPNFRIFVKDHDELTKTVYIGCVMFVFNARHKQKRHEKPDLAQIVSVHDDIILSEDDIRKMEEKDLIHVIRLELKKMELHEMDEWITLDGKQLCDPHHSGYANDVPYWQGDEPDGYNDTALGSTSTTVGKRLWEAVTMRRAFDDKRSEASQLASSLRPVPLPRQIRD